MRWTSLLVGIIFGVFSYAHLTGGSAAFGGFYLLGCVVALLAVFRRRVLWGAAAALCFGLVSLILMWPEVNLGEAMFATQDGREFMMVVLVEVWMASLIIEEIRVHGSPFAKEEEESTENQDESPEGEGADNTVADSEQP